MRHARLASLLGASLALVVLAGVAGASAVGTSFTDPTRLGYRPGDDWEPSIAADNFGHVYAFFTHYHTVCCGPHLMTLQISDDGGATWGAPSHPFPSDVSQDDPQITVDPVDGRTVYASYMQGSKSSQYVAKSTDFGQTWHTMLVEPLQRGTDKDILAVRGQDVYLVYNAVQKIYASVSHDGGKTWHFGAIVANTNSKLGWSLPGGGAIDSKGNAYFSWEGYTQNGKPSGPVNIFITKSTDGGKTWSVERVDVSQAPKFCKTCGWAFWGPGTNLAVDAQNRLYLLYNANSAKFAPDRMIFARSTDGARTWVGHQDVSEAPIGANNVFPAVAATGDGDVRIAWMDDRNGHDDGTADGSARWNVYYRSSTTAGRSWSGETQLSAPTSGYPYIHQNGFQEPYGDYMELDIGASGETQAVWGEGPSYAGPGNVWYAHS
jgi:hypothetical protein